MPRNERYVHVQDLLGRPVQARDGRVVGRIEELRVDRNGDDYEVREYLLGPGALFERLALVKRAFHQHPRTLVARWDQIDISDPRAPKLTCDRRDLKVEE
jgi:sporulation protein YlmC with PRC-barrel domain